ncbi:hypothetical protein [Dactylosporangium sp. CA-233914]|uniref:hypothetical protein n=1 Tax=Dactylosporangium sp. CA-233914 TaxID=3239934 RepID=UPI003D8F3885
MISIEIVEKDPRRGILARWDSANVVPAIGDAVVLDEGQYRVVERVWHGSLDVLLVATKEFPVE